MNMSSPFDGRNAAIYTARTFIREFVEDRAESGRLQEIALDQKKTLADLMLSTPALARFLIDGEVTIQMCERWLMEAVSNQAHTKG